MRQQLSLAAIAIFIGLLFLQETKAQGGNTQYGNGALQSNDGWFNCAFGNGALYSNTGSYNNAFGLNALHYNTTGNDNSAFGGYALGSNTTGSNNTANGYQALYLNTTGSNNTASGVYALYSNTTGSSNTANGYGALYFNTTGSFNTASGWDVLSSNTTGISNTANGYQSLKRNTTGNYNTAIGYQVLFSSTTATQNTAIGYQTLYYNTTGSYNTASGFGALDRNTAGFSNTATGMNALYFNTTGSHNVASGNYSLANNTTGSRNTALGDSAGARYSYGNSTFIGYQTTTTAALTNVTVIGYQASATASNQVRVGNNAVTSIGGKVGWTTFSDGRFKKNVKEDVPGLAFITKLRPVTYNLDIEGMDKATGISKQTEAEQITSGIAAAKEKHTGFLAQEVEKAANELNYEFGGVDKPKNDKDLYGLRYAEFVVPLVKAVQELSKENDELKSRLDKVEAMLSAQLQTEASQNVHLTGMARLEQNVPNPFNGITTIHYYLPSNKVNAYINFYSSAGQLLKSVKIASGGKGSINLNAGDLPSGVYQYALIIDGKVSDKKQMLRAN